MNARTSSKDARMIPAAIPQCEVVENRRDSKRGRRPGPKRSFWRLQSALPIMARAHPVRLENVRRTPRTRSLRNITVHPYRKRHAANFPSLEEDIPNVIATIGALTHSKTARGEGFGVHQYSWHS